MIKKLSIVFSLVFLCFSCKLSSAINSDTIPGFEKPQSLTYILKSVKGKYQIAEKISCDYNQDGLVDFIIVMRNKLEKKIKRRSVGPYYETFYPEAMDGSKRMNRYFLIVEGRGDNKYVISISSNQIIPSIDFAEELNYEDIVVPSYLSPTIAKDSLTIVIQKKLSTGKIGTELHQMNLRFVYDKESNNWKLHDCLSKYKASIRDMREGFDVDCLLTNKDFGLITLDTFNVYEMFDTEDMGCDGWQGILAQ